MSKVLTKRNGAVALALVVGLVVGTAGLGIAGDTTNQMPADKTAVAGSAVVDVDPNAEEVILQQTMKVSSPADLILGVTLECSILTRLVTTTATNEQTAQGSVDIRITIDGKDVPVQTIDEGSAGDNGSVTFCNRTYHRKVTDAEGDAGGAVDTQNDYIDTKAANGFNWVALNVGDETYYDNPANGNNILDIKVHATYKSPTPYSTCVAPGQATSCASAYVGKRTLVIEPVHAANGEQSEPAGASTSGGGSSTGLLGF